MLPDDSWHLPSVFLSPNDCVRSDSNSFSDERRKMLFYSPDPEKSFFNGLPNVAWDNLLSYDSVEDC